VVMVTGYASLDSALESLKYGAFDYIQKPFDRLDRVVDAVRRAWERRKPCLERRSAKSSLESRIYELKLLYSISRVIASCTDSRAMVVQLLESLRRIIDYDVAIALLSEGPGKTEMTLEVMNPCTPDFVDQARCNLIDALNSAAHSDMSDGAEFNRIIGRENVKPPGAGSATGAIGPPTPEGSGESRIADRLRSFLNVPLIMNGTMFGMVNVSSHRDDLFTPDIISLVYAVVSQVPAAIHRLESVKAAEMDRTVTLAEIVSEGLIMTDENLNVLLVNKAARGTIGAKEVDLPTIQDSLGIDLAGLRKQSEKGMLNVVVKQRNLNSENYEVKVSAIKNSCKAFLGFVVALRKSPATRS